MPYKINDPVCVKRKYSKLYGRIIEIIEQICPYMVLTQDGKVMTYDETELSPADPLQCLMVGDVIKSGGVFLTIEGVCGNAVFYYCEGDDGEYVDGKGWNTIKNLIRDGFSLLTPTPQEDIVEKYAKEIVENYPKQILKNEADFIKQKLNQFKEEIK